MLNKSSLRESLLRKVGIPRMAINKSALKDILSLVDFDELESDSEEEDKAEGETCPTCGGEMKGKGMEDLSSKILTHPSAVTVKPESESSSNNAKIDALVNLIASLSDKGGN